MVGSAGFGGIYAKSNDGTVFEKIQPGMYADFGGTFDKD